MRPAWARTRFGCYFDLANPLAKRGLDVPSEIRALGSLIRRVHVKDTRIVSGDCRPGTGRVDFAECARALSEIGYDGWLTLETPPAPPPLISRDVSFVRSVFTGLDDEPPWPRIGAFSRDFGKGEWEQLGETFAGLGLELTQLDGALLEESIQDPATASEGRTVLESRGIRIPALGGYRNLIAPDTDVRAANIDHLRRCLELAPALGSYVVATETGTMSSDGDWTDSPLNETDAAWSRLYDALEALLPAAEQSGTILALEAHVKHVLKTRSQMDGLLERFPSQHLQIVCDPYNYVSAELVPVHREATDVLLDGFEDRFVLAHLKDVDARGAEVGTPEFGTGIFASRRISNSCAHADPISISSPSTCRLPTFRTFAAGSTHSGHRTSIRPDKQGPLAGLFFKPTPGLEPGTPSLRARPERRRVSPCVTESARLRGVEDRGSGSFAACRRLY